MARWPASTTLKPSLTNPAWSASTIGTPPAATHWPDSDVTPPPRRPTGGPVNSPGHPRRSPTSRHAPRSTPRPAERLREDDELLSRPGHRDIAVDRSFDARAERFWVDEDDQVELEPLRQFRGQRLDAGCRPDRGIADDAGDAVSMRSEPITDDRAQVRSRCVCDGHAGAADGGRHVCVREHPPDDRLGLRHDLFWRPVVDAQRGEADLVEPDPLEPFRPRLRESVPGLGAVPDDREAPGRAAEQQHLPLCVG